MNGYDCMSICKGERVCVCLLVYIYCQCEQERVVLEHLSSKGHVKQIRINMDIPSHTQSKSKDSKEGSIQTNITPRTKDKENNENK